MGENDEQGSINSFGINERFWSGRGDLNARPPAPKSVYGAPIKWPIFNAFHFNEMCAAC